MSRAPPQPVSLISFQTDGSTAGALHPSIVDEFQTHLLERKLNNQSANKYAARFRSFLLRLEQRGTIDAAPKMETLKTALK